jgi:hypothetical protein
VTGAARPRRSALLLGLFAVLRHRTSAFKRLLLPQFRFTQVLDFEPSHALFMCLFRLRVARGVP